MISSVLNIGPNKAMNDLIGTVLASSYSLYFAEDVFNGMEILKSKEDIDLIIIDFDYQVKQNSEFILHINSSKIYNRPLIILLSAQNLKTYESVTGSNARYFLKPFNPINLTGCIEQIALSASPLYHERL